MATVGSAPVEERLRFGVRGFGVGVGSLEIELTGGGEAGSAVVAVGGRRNEVVVGSSDGHC